ncbi:MAG: type II toxin-antitoxin system VapC family toxin [Planctomycetes bacterium]|nr:type II toxin-antitoxin system VapC family toxin [Planctomycetota bacterium]
MKPSLYLETSVVSYLVARPSRDLMVLAHQEATRAWWGKRLTLFQAYVSPAVLREAARGDAEMAKSRLERLSSFPVLPTTEETEELTRIYAKELSIPARAIADAAHLAFACAYAVDYLMTWNCAHIANAMIRRRLSELNASRGVATPIICTPEELMGMEDEE